MKETHLIGFSLSLCIQDICRGKIDVNEVLFIQTSCAPRFYQDDIEEILNQYCRTYWKDFPDKARKVFQDLNKENRIGWTNPIIRVAFPIYWGHWLSINKGTIV